MKNLIAMLATLGLGVALGTSVWADDKDQAGTQTIRGSVAAITAEGELAIDYRSNQAVIVQAAYLTIVGSPVKGDKDKGSSNASSNSNDSRPNIYMVWLSPRTKVCAATGDSGKSDQKKEVTLDQLEVGDRVEVQFSPREDSNSTAGTNQTEKMRGSHGRNRTFVGDALAITILPQKRDHKSSDADKSDRGNK